MKWKGGGRRSAPAMRTWLVVVVAVFLLQLRTCRSAVGVESSIEVFVVDTSVENLADLVGLVYSVTVKFNSSVADGIAGHRGDLGSSLVCCKFSAQVGDVGDGVGRNRSQEVECSAAAATLGHGLHDPLPSGRGACLLVDSSLGDHKTGTRNCGDCNGELQLDATLAFLAYLGWVSEASANLTHNEDILLPSLHTQVECASESVAGTNLCTFNARSSSGTTSLVALARMDLEHGFYNKMHLDMSQEFQPVMVLSTNLASTSIGSGSDTVRSVIGGYTDSSCASVPIFIVRLSNSREKSAIHLSQVLLGSLGRRSLRAKIGEIAHACEYGQWRCAHGLDFFLGAVITLAGLSMLAILCTGSKEDETPADFLDTVPSLPPRFSYSKLQKATKNFSRKLGDGAFGSVYEGTLANGARVAVKMLEKTSVQGEKQFRAEVASMGAIRHLNLVRLHGFCSEGTHRLLVYEYMPNGSVDAWLFGKKQGEKLLDWEQRLNIALGTARALAYLHEECSDHIIHLDVKPENILLDHQFCPKLSDFGLAKLMDREQSRVVTSMRGTPGYLAPEWLLPHAAVTAKTDVYSFGMVLLELISGRENTNFSLGKEQWYFPAWASKLVGEGRTMELLDKRLHVEEVEYFHKKDAMRAIHCALLCIQDDPSARPPMSRVVHMLQGHVEPEPLNARQSAIQPPRRLLTAFAASRSGIEAGNMQGHEQPLHQPPQHQTDGIHHHQVVGPAVSNRISVAESPRVKESPRVMNLASSPRTLQELDSDRGDHFDRMEPLPPAVQMPNQARGSNASRMAGAHSISGNQKSIPPWPVKGDIILTRCPQGDQHCVVRDVRVQGKQMRLAILHRLSSETRWSVREEEQNWRNWNESVKTLDFWVVVRWSTIPGRGFEKYPVEWMTR
ncbi:uncharacterized protein [Physcomitrium patens]|uniref:non-specific serine/threonine protein kinase n=1 Tax=Physcomitrium patens TaxID=3218 RepID=A0A2K1IDV4_PHYPA|nr:uncharacterized protein LOC112277344 [Physcomitrium patens]PNR27459.1 hypothetical protein PHYPA_029611 [Physcomitrium patens]|eukprot:XP_024365302.1 uncharacterized protein LOC112277344 [Physcomitrella patens]